MQSWLVGACLVVSLALGAPGHAVAATLTPIADSRLLGTTTRWCHQTGPCSDSSLSTLPPSPFADFDSAMPGSAGVEATQTSTLNASSFAADGGAIITVYALPAGYTVLDGWGVSWFEVRFLLDEAAFVTFSGELAFDVSAPASAELSSKLCIDRCNSTPSLFQEQISTPLGDSTRTFSFAEVLPAGVYTVLTSATGRGGGPNGGAGSLSYSVQLAVPEPGALSLIALALAAGLLRRSYLSLVR